MPKEGLEDMSEDLVSAPDAARDSDVSVVDDMGDMSAPPDLNVVVDMGMPEDLGPRADMRTNPIDLGSFDFGTNEDQGPSALALTGVNPPRGPLAGATPFVILGDGFTPNTTAVFGSEPVRVELVDGVLVGETPPGAGPGGVTVRVLDPDLGVVALENAFTYTPTLGINSVSPSRVPTTGLVEVDVVGEGFDDSTRISFGGAASLRHTLIDPTLIRVIIPPALSPGAVDVRVTNQDDSKILLDGVTYFARPTLSEVIPGAGPLAGGNEVTLVGEGFEPDMEVFFEGVATQAAPIILGPDKATVVVPPRAQSGMADVSLVTQDGAVIKENSYFYYADSAALSIVQISPSSGPLSGGQRVTLYGEGLDDPALEFFIDDALCAVVTRAPGVVELTTPAGMNTGAVDVRVDTVVSPGAYTYVDTLDITQVSPASGDVSGGDVVTVTGAGLADTESVSFGALTTDQITARSDTSLEVIVPPHPAGTVDVTVSRGDLDATLNSAYAYTQDAALYGFSPVRGSVAGNTYVVMRGVSLDRVMQVEFGGVPATSVEVLDPQTIAVKTPAALLPSSVDVTLTLDSGESLTASDQYVYFNPGARFGGAWGGSIQGSVNVTVYSQGGGPIENAFVMLSTRPDTQYQGYTDLNGMVTLSGAEVLGEQSITAIAAGHSSATVQRVDAENITVFLSPPPNPGDPPPGALPATFRGKLTGLNKLAEPGPSQFAMAFVYTTQANTNTPNPNPGTQNTLLMDGDYSITSRLGDLALVAVGGLYDNATQTFLPLRMGVARYQFASEGMIYEDVDIDLNIVLDRSFAVKMNNTPSHPLGPNNKRIDTWMDFGFEGVFGGLPPTLGTNTESLLQVERLPDLNGELLGVDFYVEAGTYTNGSAPLSVGFLRNITQFSQIYNVDMVDVPRMTSPGEGGRPLNGLVTFEYNSPDKPDLFYVRVQTFMQQTRWEGFLPGDATSISLPEFPDFSDLPADQRPEPYTNEPLVLLIIGIKQPGLDFNQFNYTDLSQDQWTAYAIALHTITL